MVKGAKLSNPEVPACKSETAKHCWLWFALVVVLTLATRFYKVTEPDHVWYVYSI